MAATTTIKRELPALKTPLTAPLSAYPSELRSPAVMTTPTYIKREDAAMKTPITPPAAYLDFLMKLSPTLASPLSAGPTSSSRFSFERPLLTSSTSSESFVSAASSNTSVGTAVTEQGTASQPSSPRAQESSRARSSSTDSKKSDTPVPRSTSKPVPTPTFTRSTSGRTPHRLHIPQSPYSPNAVRSPLSASSVRSPYSATRSPRDWHADKEPLSANPMRTVSVRQVVTRTVQYSTRAAARTPIVDPVPASKKRKLDV